MVRIHSNEEALLKYGLDHELFTSADAGVHGNHISRLCKNGFLVKVDRKFNVCKITDEGRKLIESGDYTISNKCVVCGKIHGKSTKTCSRECYLILARENAKNFSTFDDNYPDIRDKCIKWIEEHNYPKFISGNIVVGDIEHDATKRLIYMVLSDVLKHHGYVRYNTNRTYIRKDCIAGEGVAVCESS